MSRIQKNWNKSNVTEKIDSLLSKFDDGELFVEEMFSESIVFDDNKIKTASFDQDKGFGLRIVKDEEFKFFHSSDLTDESLNEAIKYMKTLSFNQKNFNNSIKSKKTNTILYNDTNPISQIELKKKISFLKNVNKFARSLDTNIKQVSISLSGNFQKIEVTRANGLFSCDSRPLVRMNLNISVEKKGKTESGSYGLGGRYMYDNFFSNNVWQNAVKKAYDQALTRLNAIEIKAGEQTVVLGPGWPGILLHEAIGHGLEGDFNRKKTSAFHSLVGKKVASDQVTVVDDGTIPNKRGSLTIDDEGTPSQNTVLIERGVLKGFMQDRHNAKLMGQESTGNGRRQSYSNIPMPRMTNTYMLNGKYSHDEIIRSTKKGIFASQFSGGQVDNTSGKFVFSASEAYEIENGKLGKPLKGATLIGNGPEALKEVTMVGNNLELDQGIGTCGKEGQSVPVGVGQPSLKINKLTVGGTK